jgi:hypothetical protein
MMRVRINLVEMVPSSNQAKISLLDPTLLTNQVNMRESLEKERERMVISSNS